MFEKIIVPLDGSKLAEVALPYAEELGVKAGADIVLFTVLDPGEAHEYEKYYNYAKKIKEVTEYHSRKYFESKKDEAIKVMTVTRTDNPAEGIIKYARLKGFPLIIMASHGRSGISRWTVGSVADTVVRSSSFQPVMLIRAKHSHSDIRDKRLIKKALVPLDGSARSESVVPYIMEMASSLQMELTFFQVVLETNHTYIDAEAYLQSVCIKYEDKSVNTNYKINVGAIAENIIDFADEFTFDIVAMSTRGASKNDVLSIGSIAQKVFLGGNTPLLLIKK